MVTGEDIYTVPGFLAGGIQAGIKVGCQKDLALLFSTIPATAAGVFTLNCFKAAPVLIDQERIKSGVAQAILINSGNANAATGEEGYRDAISMSRFASDRLHIKDDLVLVASTGIIGQKLPIGKIENGMDKLLESLRANGIADAEDAIMTTDKFPKISFRKALIDGKEVTVCGIAKGAGMIEPHMATMLAFVMSDVNIDASILDRIFRQTVNDTFNAVTVDGCMSTNDSAIILANGLANNPRMRSYTKSLYLFKDMLYGVLSELSKAIVKDGEGATKIIEVLVDGAFSTTDAKKVSYAIANSNLVKTAVFGCDPNWGRILSAAGSIPLSIPVNDVTISIGDILVFAHGIGCYGKENELAKIMDEDIVRIHLNLGMGNKAFVINTSDLSFDYIKINAHYHT